MNVHPMRRAVVVLGAAVGLLLLLASCARGVDDELSAQVLIPPGASSAALDVCVDTECPAPFATSMGRTELTGMDTALFAFGVSSGVIAGLDKTNAQTNVTYRTSAISHYAAFAFAHWGGDFYVFTGTTTSVVTRYSPAADESKVVVDNAGILIVGAGSSTCAPTKRPN